MSEERPQFPDYGDNGDTAGVRRARRSFRLVVVAFVGVTCMLWVSEQWLQYDHAEGRFITSLTHERTSARVILLEAIRADTLKKDKPTPKYTQALAVRSEHDVILDLYLSGVLLDPTNSLFRIRYGCRLFLMGQSGEAAKQFSEAAAQPQANALPLYLEAAAMAESGSTLAEALAKVATANSREDSLVFPRPIWARAYPQYGYWYANLSREIYDEACAPMYRLSQKVTEEVSRQIDQSRFDNARIWLTELMRMGERLMASSEPLGTTQALAGLTIQLQALEMLDKLGAPMNGMTDEALIERRLRLNQALDQLRAFESERESRIEAEIAKYTAPLWLIGIGLSSLIGVHLVGLLVYRTLRFKKSRWTVPHSTLGKAVLASGIALFFLVLWALTAMQHASGISINAVNVAVLVGYCILGALLVFGLLYPAATLKSVEEVSRKSSRLEDMDQTVRLARQSYRRAYASLSLRYYGILSGASTCVICAWIIGYRILVGLWPWQYQLLASGMLDAERSVVREAIALLSSVGG